MNHFASEWIGNSKIALFDLCPSSSQRFDAHKGPQKDVNNVKSCLKVLNEVGENVSIFLVCLEKLREMEKLSMDVTAMKRAMTAQTNVVTADMNQQLREIEQQAPDKVDMHIPRAN